MKIYIGIDISKDTFDAATSNQKQSVSFKNSPAGFKKLIKWLSAIESPHIAMEATGKYYLGLALHLYEQGYPVYVINPYKIKHHAQSQLKRVKTDSEDAKLIAEFCEVHPLNQWQPDSPMIAKLQEFSALQDLLIRTKARLKNQMKSTLDLEVQKIQDAQITQLEEQIEEVQLQMKSCIEQDVELTRQVALLTTIKGLGEKTAIELITHIKDIYRFDNAKCLASYSGLVPKIQQSGTSLNRSSLSKMGNVNLRKCLYMPAVNSIAYNPVLKAFANNLRNRGVAGKKIVAAVMRKLIHLVYAILKSGKPFDPEYKIRA